MMIIIKRTSLLQHQVLYVGLGVFLFQLQFHLPLSGLVSDLLRPALGHFEGRQSEKRRWPWSPGALRDHGGLGALLGAIEPVAVLAVVVVPLVDVQDVFIRAEVLAFGVLLQLMRLGAPVHSVDVVMTVMMELYLLRLLLAPFPSLVWRGQIQLLLLYLLLFDESIKVVPHHQLVFHFRTE